MNIRANIFGGARSPDERVVQLKKPKGVDEDSLDRLIEREEALTNHQRFEDRHRLLEETVQIKRAGETFQVQLINLSGGGAMVTGDVPLLLWDRVELCLGDGGVECAVRWVRKGRFGLEFAHETRIDCGADEQAVILREVIRRSFPDLEFEADTETGLTRSGPDGRGDHRHPLVWSGLLHHDCQSTQIRLRNISSTGALIDCAEYLTVGSEPLLELGGKVTMSATVTWVIGEQAGLRFTKPFDLHDLASCRPQVASSAWEPPAYLEGAEAGSGQHWGRMSLGELRNELEGFLKR